jgi:hypothetical protein
MRLNPFDSKGSEVLDVTHNSVWICKRNMVGLCGSHADILPVPFQLFSRVATLVHASRCSLETLFWKKEKDGVNLDLPPLSREDCEHDGDIAQLVER